MLSYPNLAPEAGDILIAGKKDSWGHTADGRPEIDHSDNEIEIVMGERLDQPHGEDTFNALVNGSAAQIHIDLITDIFQLADELRYSR